MTATLTVLGAGHVGLTTAACFAHLGHAVTCVDTDDARIRSLRDGTVPFFEEGLELLVRQGQAAKRLRFSTDARRAVRSSEFVYLCVPTPEADDGSADLSFIEGAVAVVARDLLPGSIVVNKSSAPVGSTRVISRALCRPDVAVVANPEFLREGSAVLDFLEPDRVVVGSAEPGAATRVAALFDGVDAPIVLTDAESAETIKYAANGYLAMKVSFANAIAAFCEAVEANVDDVLPAVGYDRRIGHEFLRPGPGWGGSCFPKDTRATIRAAEQAGYDFGLLREVVAVNEEQLARVVAKIERAAGRPLAGVTVAVLGLTFKAGTDDLRHSPAVVIVSRLLEERAVVRVYDPMVRCAPVAGVSLLLDPYEACHEAEVLVVLTEWDEFAKLDPGRVGREMASRSVVDARNILDADSYRLFGFNYQGIGR